MTRAQGGMARVTEALGGHLGYGGDYNPEQWPHEVWPQDVRLMQEAGVNLVSVGIFSWGLLEPAEGSYDFGWLDQVLDLLHEGGIRVDLATGTATPPPWFFHAYPGSMLVDQGGARRWYGARQSFCPSSPDYRAAAARLTRAIVDRYARHPAVVMWHVHNEYGCHNAHCFCDTSAAAFRSWLQHRYASSSDPAAALDALNTAWGTAFWSQRYRDWAEVIPPRVTAYRSFANPTQQLDYWRFSSDELLACFRAEAAIVRERSDKPVTTNFMSFFKEVDYWGWSKEQDLVSNDYYLRAGGLGPDDALSGPHDLAMSGDLMRSLAGGPWLLMESATSAVNWQPRNPAKDLGQLRRDSLMHVAHGADGVLFFQWRASAAGAEKYHSGMLPHAGTDSRLWRDVTELGTQLASLREVAGSRVDAPAAILLDWQSWWALELDSHPNNEVEMVSQVRAYHRALWESGITCDFVHPEDDLDRYRLVLVPTLYLTSDEAAANLTGWVERGGTAVVSWFSGIVDRDDHIRLGGYPGAFVDLLGVRVEEFAPLLPGVTVRVEGLGAPAAGALWTERGEALDAEVVATYEDGPAAGCPAVTAREAGLGRAWYVGTVLDPLALQSVLLRAAAQAGVSAPPGRVDDPEVQIIRRTGATRDYAFVVNYSAVPVTVPLEGTDLLTGRHWRPDALVAGGDVLVLRVGEAEVESHDRPTH